MNGLRAVQNLLKSNAKSDELKALEMLKDWKVIEQEYVLYILNTYCTTSICYVVTTDTIISLTT